MGDRSIRRPAISLPTIQLLLLVLSATSILSAAWLVLHARDVTLVLRHVLPLDPGAGKRLASFRLVCAVMTLFGFSVSSEVFIVLRVALA